MFKAKMTLISWNVVFDLLVSDDGLVFRGQLTQTVGPVVLTSYKCPVVSSEISFLSVWAKVS